MEERIGILERRARRLREKGEFRKAANTYGELTSVEPGCARWWVLMGAMLVASRRTDEANKALRQAMYLLRQAGEDGRERALREYVVRMDDAPRTSLYTRGGGRRRAYAA